MALKEYKKKRDFSKTKEPKGKIVKKKRKDPIFVVQKHDASRLHYDFRIEDNGVLKSWAVPKGPSPDPRDKRLAMMVEDHPIDYANFEGIIEEGYGAGTVMVWDKGTYRNMKWYSIKDSIKKGIVEIELKGKKMKGAYVLIKLKRSEDQNTWLLIKMNDKFAGKKYPNEKSVKSGKTMREIEKGK